MKKILIYTIILTAAGLFSSCDLLFGPFKDISLQQRLEKGWVKEDLFNTPVAVVSVSKMSLFKYKDEVRGIAGTGYTAGQSIFWFKKDTINNIGSFAMQPLTNVFDLYSDGSSYEVIYYDGTTSLNIYKNDSPYGSTGPGFFLTSYILLSSFDTVVGNITGFNLGKAGWPALSSPTTVFTVNPINTIKMDKARGTINGHSTIIYGVPQGPTAPYTYRIGLADADAGQNLLYSDLIIGDQQIFCAIGDGKSLYVVTGGGILKYNNGPLNNEIFIPDMPSGNNSFLSGCFLGDNLIILTVGPSPDGDKVKLFNYNTIRKSYTVKTFDNASSKIVGADIFYDDKTGIIYVGVMEYNGAILKGYWYKNQLN